MVLNSGYQILLEADLVGILFHLMFQDPQIENNIHLDTRLSYETDKKKKIEILNSTIEAKWNSGVFNIKQARLVSK